MVATNHDMRELERIAKRQGWKITHTGGNHLRWTPPHGRAVMTSLTPSNNYAINMIERDLEKAGLKLDVEYTREKKKVATVQDLIKANGAGEPIAAAKSEPMPEKRVRRAGLDREILNVLRGSYPQEIDFTTLKMRVSINSPGVTQSTLHNYIKVLKVSGKVVNPRMGYYRAASADVSIDGPAPEAEKVPLEPILPGEAKLVIDALKLAVEGAEKMIVRLNRQLAEQEEATAAIKRMAARL